MVYMRCKACAGSLHIGCMSSSHFGLSAASASHRCSLWIVCSLYIPQILTLDCLQPLHPTDAFSVGVSRAHSHSAAMSSISTSVVFIYLQSGHSEGTISVGKRPCKGDWKWDVSICEEVAEGRNWWLWFTKQGQEQWWHWQPDVPGCECLDAQISPRLTSACWKVMGYNMHYYL